MNETDWLSALEPLRMLRHLEATASARKLRLFACACVRRRWELLRFATPRRAVELAERLAEGKAEAAEVEQLRQQAEVSVYNAPEFERLAYQAAAATLAEEAREAARNACDCIHRQAIFEEASAAMSREDEARAVAEATASESRALGLLLHEVFGNPFRPVKVEPAWRHTSDAAVLALARWIDEERRLEELPYLADALADAGCTEETLVRHLREPGGHVRGCWALDAILGRS